MIKFIRKNYTLFFIIGTLLFTTTYFIYDKKTKATETSSTVTLDEKTVYIDVGHGGFDPGFVKKTSGKEIYEKNVNLEISLLLEELLQEMGYNTIINRTVDKALASTKNQDMRNRVYLINSSNADISVSIHQNSFNSSKASGAQVFFHTRSEEGKLLATHIQKTIKEMASWSNKKDISPNDDYYLLRKTTPPSVIVECGFLSNANDLKKLTNPEYQEVMANAIATGIDNYFNHSN